MKNGVIHACLKTKGKKSQRGTIHIVGSARKCNRRKGEQGVAGPTGTAGAQGEKARRPWSRPKGLEVLQGTVGTVGEVTGKLTSQCTSLKETVTHANALTSGVSELTGALSVVLSGVLPKLPEATKAPTC